MDRDALSALALAHLVNSLLLALGALDVADVPHEDTLRQLQTLEDVRAGLEASTVTLLKQAGVSWEAMAEQLGVTRQSLHRRLSRKSLHLQGVPQRITGRGLMTEWDSLIVLLGERVEELKRSGPTQTSMRVADELLARRTRRQRLKGLDDDREG